MTVSIDALIFTSIMLVILIGVYKWGWRQGFATGVNATANTLVHLKIIKEEDLNKLTNIDLGDKNE